MSKQMREMKDSGIEWIGEIPKEWEINKIGSIYDERSTKVSDRDFTPLSVTKNGIVPQLETAAKTDNGENRKLIKKNDFVINSRSDRRGSCGISEYEGSCSLINTVLMPRKNMCNSYYSYVFRSELFADEFYRWGTGIVDDLWSTKWSNMKNIYIPSPSIETQHRIADYLDDKCGKIDRYIEQQKQVIEKLKAYKQSVITEAVTKGLDPTVPMKDSGVEWIGEIPESWVVVKATRLILSTQNGLTRRDLEKSNGNIVLKLRNINSRGEIDYSEINRIVLSSKEVETYQLIDGDFLFVRVNGSRSLVGKCAIYNGISEIVAYNDHIIRVRLNNFCDKDFFKWFLLSDVGKKEIDIHTSTSAGQFTISGDGLRNLNVILPKKEIQREIVVYLNQKCSSIDFAIEKKQALIEKLTEYKKSLIYEVVTGKKEV